MSKLVCLFETPADADESEELLHAPDANKIVN